MLETWFKQLPSNRPGKSHNPWKLSFIAKLIGDVGHVHEFDDAFRHRSERAFTRILRQVPTMNFKSVTIEFSNELGYDENDRVAGMKSLEVQPRYADVMGPSGLASAEPVASTFHRSFVELLLEQRLDRDRENEPYTTLDSLKRHVANLQKFAVAGRFRLYIQLRVKFRPTRYKVEYDNRFHARLQDVVRLGLAVQINGTHEFAPIEGAPGETFKPCRHFATVLDHEGHELKEVSRDDWWHYEALLDVRTMRVDLIDSQRSDLRGPGRWWNASKGHGVESIPTTN